MDGVDASFAAAQTLSDVMIDEVNYSANINTPEDLARVVQRERSAG